jgi:hypothetical protein
LRFIVAFVSFGIAASSYAWATPIPNSVCLGSLPAVCRFGADGVAADVVGADSGSNPTSSDLPATPGDAPEAELPDAPDAAQSTSGGSLDNAQSGGSSGGSGSVSGSTAGNSSGSTNTPQRPAPKAEVPVDANGNPIPLERIQPQRILGFMPNFRSVSGGAKPHPPGWKYNFTVATRQATDYSSFIFLGLTSLSAEGINEHPVLGKGVDGMWAYTWRGFLDKTDGTYLSAWFLPSLIHEDTRFYAMGAGHNIFIRELYVISRQGVTRTYGGHQTPNIAGLGGKILTQLVSRQYYPTSATTFPVLAEKFGYSAMRDVMFTSIREFYPDAAAHFIREHRKKMAEKAAARDASSQ